MRHSLGEPLPHQLADTWQAAPEAPELCSCEIIWDYPVFRRAIPNFGVRSYLLLPRLPVIPYHFYNNRPRATEANMFILTFILIKRFR